MPFRSKLAIAFATILLLTITVAVINWWGMDTALKRQETIFETTLDVDRLFAALSQEQHSFITTLETHRTLDIQRLLEELQHALQRLAIQGEATAGDSKQPEVMSDLLLYRDTFQVYFTSLLAMQSMQTRILHESERLLAAARDYQATNQAAGQLILDMVASLLLAEKSFAVSRDIETGTQISTIIQQLEEGFDKPAGLVSGKETLLFYAVIKTARQYHRIFTEYTQVLTEQRQTLAELDSARAQLFVHLHDYTASELLANQETVHNLKRLTYAVSLTAVLLSIGLTLLLSSLITKPIDQLKNSAAEIIAGNYTTQVPIRTEDEIGQLAGLFNRMVSQLQKSFAELATYRDRLEDLVAKRTTALEKEILERSQAEESLRANEEQLRLIIDQSPVAIILWDTHFRVKRWNREAEAIFGYSHREAMQLSAKSLLPARMHQHLGKIWRKISITQEGIRSRNENITRSGESILCDWFNSPIVDSKGNMLGALSLVENVTEKMRLEAEQRKLDKIESTGVLAGGIAHDFNNILTGILGNINLAQASADLPQRSRNLLNSAEKAAIRAKSLTQQLLTFAKGGEPIKQATSLAEVIHDSASFVLHGGNVRAHFQLDHNLWHGMVDKNQISQVIQNIVLNARHAMPHGGVVAIEAVNLSKGEDTFPLLAKDKRYIRIKIRDNGIGIPGEMLDKIFDPYFSTKEKGSGLGLAVTLSIIRKHDGHIQVHSEPGQGTEFVVYLPASPTTGTDQEQPASLQEYRKALGVLVVDDDQEVLVVLQAMLLHLGHQVWLTTSGEEAMILYREQLAQGTPPALVIADLTIPGGMGGRELLPQLRLLHPEARAIVSSGYSNDPVMANYQKYGFVAAMSKPYVLEELQRAIDQALETTIPPTTGHPAKGLQ